MNTLPLREIIATLPQVGRLVSIGLRPERRAPLVAVDRAELSVAEGLIGDHYQGKSKKRQLTLIQAEHLGSVSSMLGGKTIDPLLTRRNLVITGVNLLAFKGRRFSIGEVVLEMTGPCEPCSRMEENFGPGGYNAMRGHGGICAKVIHGGAISVGDEVKLTGPDTIPPA